jgi:hypothetical protein
MLTKGRRPDALFALAVVSMLALGVWIAATDNRGPAALAGAQDFASPGATRMPVSGATPVDTPTDTATDTVTNTPTTTPTATPEPVLVCHVTWQGIRVATPAAAWSRSITATLRMASGGDYYDFSGTTDESGYYTIPLATLPSGTFNYDIRVQGPNNLATCDNITFPHRGITRLDIGQQPSGDADRNNVVNATDFIILKNTNGIACGQPSFDGRADYNNDCLVSAIDFTLLKANIGFAGCGQLRNQVTAGP